jgi:UDP-N-acetylglucosamine 2-epimerase (non-hydrolysing)
MRTTQRSRMGNGEMLDRVKVLSVFGTRPEVIKLAPLIIKMADQPKRFTSVACSTGQHDRMLRQALRAFEISADYNLDVMTVDQRLSELTAKLVVGLEKVIAEVQPSVLLVQGDTTTTFSAALAAFYSRVPVSHVEAGLRSWDSGNPFPEETNRVLTDRLSSYFFAPTEQNRRNLLAEGVNADRIFVTGNTAIDALMMMRARVADADPHTWDDAWGSAGAVIADKAHPLILVTAHRRESFGTPFQAICEALKELANDHPAWSFVYPVHLNPNVQDVVNTTLGNIRNIHLIQPLDYDAFVYLMDRAHLILTDSGGIQEEAPSLQKPVIVMREKTERTEAIEAGAAILVGTQKENIKNAVEQLMTDRALYESVRAIKNPYGDGFAADRILDHLYGSLHPDKLELCSSPA